MMGETSAPRWGNRLIAVAVVAGAVLLPLSIQAAEWAPRSGTLIWICGLSLACGALIAPARLPRAARWPLITLAGLALAAANAGLIAMGQAGLARLANWATDLTAGRIISDSGLVTFWVTLLIWWAGYSAAHGVASGGFALNALLPTVAALAVNSIYTRQDVTFVVGAVFAVVIVLAWTTHGKRLANWTARGLDYPDLWPEWIGSGLMIAGLVCTLAWLFPMLTSPSSVQWLKGVFNPPTTQAIKVAEQMLGGATPIPLSPSASGAGLGSNLGLPTSRLIGSPPELAQQLVMWVRTDHPPPLPEQAPVSITPSPLQRPYWRGVTYATYTGRGWSNPPLASKPLAPVPRTPLRGVLGPLASSTLPGNLTQRFDIIAAHGDTLFAANQPVSATAKLTALTAGEDIVGLRGTLALYTVTSRIVTATEEMLLQAPLTVTAEMTRYLQLPSTLPKRVRELSMDITANAPTPYDKAVSIETYLRTYSYTLNLPPFPAGRDLVDYFLFDAPGGYCDYYASAMVVMLRVVGVPARLASGYLTGAYDPKQGAYRVIGANAHSWPEVYFEGIGWVEFEPTAGQPVLAHERSAPPPIGLSSEQVRAAEVERLQRATLTRNIALLSSTLVLASGALAVYWLRRERRLAALPADAAIPLLYQRLRQRSQWLGVTIRPSDTPDEFVAAFNLAVKRCVAARWPASAAIAQDSAMRIGELYRRASYSPTPPGANEARQAWSAWRALSLRAWWIGWWGKTKSLARRTRTHGGLRRSIRISS